MGSSAFSTLDSGRNWIEVSYPPLQNGRVIYAGDNGIVPGLYSLPVPAGKGQAIANGTLLPLEPVDMDSVSGGY